MTPDLPAARASALLTIDVGAVAANWRQLRDRLGPGKECAGVVKADAYGLGIAAIAPALAQAGCRHFVVAIIDEGITLRKLLPEAEIIVLGGPWPGCEEDFAEHRLIPVLNSPEQIAAWRALCARRGPLSAVLHLDTGMARLGLTPAERDALRPEDLKNIPLALVMSHLACADEAGNEMNARQLAEFREGLARLQKLLGRPLRASFANSSGIFLGPDYHFDLGRPGVALYGVNPCPGSANPMAPVVRLQGRIIQVRDVDSPQTVGYGATHRVTRRSRIATVAVGYADGYLRYLGNKGCASIGGFRVPVVGRVSMDLITLDVTDIPSPLAHAGAFADLIGPDHDVDALATEAGTIGYEILTSLGNRYHRRYVVGTP
ncbi:alanine racemase [Telmatospirillum sp. J64-1]|uniref:alanine racemase n=1 Tax=Telmatospirillum sp. J64-1 TaxID=2502183 RepID=UPI00115E303B|nr:alanine racemase [Telmatospirillum sp. J64-1]